MEFETAKAYLDRLGVEYIQKHEWRGEPGNGREQVKLPIFTHVDPCLTALNWMNLATRDGDSYIGGCCGQTSMVQDEINYIYRFDPHTIPIEKLSGIAEAMIVHDGESSYFSQDPWEWGDWPEDVTLDGWPSLLDFLTSEYTGFEADGVVWENLRPWFKLGIVWHLVKDNWTPPIPGAIRRDMDEVDRAICTLDEVASAINWHRVFGGLREDVRDRDRVRRALSLARFIPALKLLTEKVEELDLGAVEGWALIDVEKGDDAIAENGLGLCIYGDRAEMNRVLAIWRKDDANHEERKPEKRIEERIGIRPIRVDYRLPSGFEFTGPVERL